MSTVGSAAGMARRNPLWTKTLPWGERATKPFQAASSLTATSGERGHSAPDGEWEDSEDTLTRRLAARGWKRPAGGRAPPPARRRHAGRPGTSPTAWGCGERA